MRGHRQIWTTSSLAVGLLCVSISAFAQSPAPSTPSRTIGVPTGAEMAPIPSLIVMNARGANLQGQKLTLTGVSANSIVFADRPERAAGHALTTHLLEEWKQQGTFANDPPNATVSAFSKDGSVARDAVVVLKSPTLEGDNLIFDVAVLEGDLSGADGPASVFIDRFGFAYGGFARGGFARVGGGRFGYGRVGVGAVGIGRGVWYRGAPVAAAAALGAGAAAVGAYGAAAPCGVYPYPPCY